jgi:hypothetical protein
LVRNGYTASGISSYGRGYRHRTIENRHSLPSERVALGTAEPHPDPDPVRSRFVFGDLQGLVLRDPDLLATDDDRDNPRIEHRPLVSAPRRAVLDFHAAPATAGNSTSTQRAAYLLRKKVSITSTGPPSDSAKCAQ